MRPPSSSKNPKKNSDEDRSRKKKIKSKSAKRRRDSSISSYSSSSSQSEPERDSRSRRKSSKSKKLEKRRKQSKSKKPEKRKSRKKRYYSDSSVSSYSDSSASGRRCPTCSDSERSRSPVRTKPKSRKRDRKSSQLYESKSKSKRSRYRSPSCSARSSGGGSRSLNLSRRPSPNPIEERFGGSCGHSPIGERFDGGRWQSPIEETYRYKDDGETKRLRSVLAVTKPSDEDDDKIVEAYDDYPSSRSNEVCEEGNKKIDLNAENGKNESYDTRTRDDVTLSKDGWRPMKDSLVSEPESAKDYAEEESEAVGGDSGKEADDLELILRKKALENFRNFRGRRPANRDSVNDKKEETPKPESYEGSQKFEKKLESKDPNSPADHQLVKGGALPNELKARSAASMPAEKNDGNGSFKPVANAITRQNMSSHLKTVQKFSNKLSAEETLLPKDNQDKMVVGQPCSVRAIRAEGSTSDRPASVVLNTDNQNYKSNEPIGETASGSQFEQKTFSKVCDGETVQVSYKVYIPKKAPALARRQLQR